MVARRAVPAFLLALLMSTLLTWILGKRIAHPSVVGASTLRMEHIVVVNKDLSTGDTLEPSSLHMLDWPASSLPAGAVFHPQELAGRVLLVPMVAGQPVLTRFVAPSGTGSGLLARIPSGMRAISIHTDEVSSVAGFVTPDSFVDILMTQANPGHDEASTSTLLQDVRVLAIGQRFDNAAQPQEKGSPQSEAVTLLLSPRDAQKLTHAVSQGKILLVLRNGADRDVVSLADFAERTRRAGQSDSEIQAAQSRGNHAVKAAPREAVYTVQTIAGNKQTDEDFGGKP